MKILNTVIKVVHVGNNTRFAVGTPGFRFWAGHQVADVPGESFVTPSFYPGKVSPLPSSPLCGSALR